MSNLAFVDTETTGLDSDRHQIWEMAIITESYEFEAHLPVDLARADPMALTIGRFYERRPRVAPMLDPGRICRIRWGADDKWLSMDQRDIAADVARFLDGKHVVGAVPDFDARFLTRWLRANGHAPTWHYHLVCVENLVAGKLGLAPPWDSSALSAAVGVDRSTFDKHTALGDARWAKALYEAVMP